MNAKASIITVILSCGAYEGRAEDVPSVAQEQSNQNPFHDVSVNPRIAG
jgi:hypothetical protein